MVLCKGEAQSREVILVYLPFSTYDKVTQLINLILGSSSDSVCPNTQQIQIKGKAWEGLMTLEEVFYWLLTYPF